MLIVLRIRYPLKQKTLEYPPNVMPRSKQVWSDCLIPRLLGKEVPQHTDKSLRVKGDITNTVHFERLPRAGLILHKRSLAVKVMHLMPAIHALVLDVLHSSMSVVFSC